MPGPQLLAGLGFAARREADFSWSVAARSAAVAGLVRRPRHFGDARCVARRLLAAFADAAARHVVTEQKRTRCRPSPQRWRSNARPPITAATAAAPGTAGAFAQLIQDAGLPGLIVSGKPAVATLAPVTQARSRQAVAMIAQLGGDAVATPRKLAIGSRPPAVVAPHAKHVAAVPSVSDSRAIVAVAPITPPAPEPVAPTIPEPLSPAAPAAGGVKPGGEPTGAALPVGMSLPQPDPAATISAQPDEAAKAAVPAPPHATAPAAETGLAPSGGQTAAAVAITPSPPIEALHPIARTIAAAAPPEIASAPRLAAAPAAQLQGALWTLAKSGGSQVVTISLHPDELGRVEVRLDRDAGGTTQVALLVERPDTLHALVRDQAQLGQVLDRAGVPAEARSITIQAAALPQGSSAPSGGSAGGGNGGADDRRPGPAPSGGVGFAFQDAAPTALPGARWVRAGIDITA